MIGTENGGRSFPISVKIAEDSVIVHFRARELEYATAGVASSTRVFEESNSGIQGSGLYSRPERDQVPGLSRDSSFFDTTRRPGRAER